MADLLIKLTTVDKVEPHPNADKLELATVGGWQCVVGKGNWQAGDECVYFPPDAMLPEDRCKEFEIENYVSRSSRYPGYGRLRAIKLRGEPSFGLLIKPPEQAENLDLAFHFGVKKFEPPRREAQLVGRTMYGWPDQPDSILCSHCAPNNTDDRDERPPIHKREGRGLVCSVCGYHKPVATYAAEEVPTFPRYTDIQNLRHYPTEIFLPGEQLVITEKIHGANCRVGVTVAGETPILHIKRWEEMAGSHNVRRLDPADNGDGDGETTRRNDTYWFPWTLESVQKTLDLYINGPHPVSNSIVIYGEVYGPGIQTLTYGRDSLGFGAFDIKVDGKYLPWTDFLLVCSFFGIPTVPELEVCEWQGEKTLDLIRALSAGPTTLGGGHLREGVVVRPLVEERSHPKIGRCILKWVGDEFLVSKHHEATVADDDSVANEEGEADATPLPVD